MKENECILKRRRLFAHLNNFGAKLYSHGIHYSIGCLKWSFFQQLLDFSNVLACT